MSSEPGNESFFCALRPIPRILSLRRRDYASQVQIGEPSRRKTLSGCSRAPDQERGGSLLGFVNQQFQSFVEGGIAAVGKVCRRKDGYHNIRRHAHPIEGLAVLCEVDLVRKPKCPSVG